MKKEKELLVAIASQKGGVGKSVFTVLLASVLHYRKDVRVADSLDVRYRAQATGRLCSEWNLSLPPGEDEMSPGFRQEEGQVRIDTPSLTLICAHNADDLWVGPVVATVQTDRGAEAVTQGWSLVFVKDLDPEAETMPARQSRGTLASCIALISSPTRIVSGP